MDERLTFFFESFKMEGSSRGQNVNMEDIIGQIIDIDTDGVLGRCNQLTSGEKHLMIDRLFWETATTGYVSDLNWDVLTGFDGPSRLSEFEFNF